MRASVRVQGGWWLRAPCRIRAMAAGDILGDEVVHLALVASLAQRLRDSGLVDLREHGLQLALFSRLLRTLISSTF